MIIDFRNYNLTFSMKYDEAILSFILKIEVSDNIKTIYSVVANPM